MLKSRIRGVVALQELAREAPRRRRAGRRSESQDLAVVLVRVRHVQRAVRQHDEAAQVLELLRGVVEDALRDRRALLVALRTAAVTIIDSQTIFISSLPLSS
jgi:hypothetical protein